MRYDTKEQKHSAASSYRATAIAVPVKVHDKHRAGSDGDAEGRLAKLCLGKALARDQGQRID
jgi:hypothetical protein